MYFKTFGKQKESLTRIIENVKFIEKQLGKCRYQIFKEVVK